jgi:predicted HTH domain antitoxin
MARKRLPTIEEVFEDMGWTADWERRKALEIAIALVNDGDTVERAARIAGITVEELEQYL